MEKPAPRIEFYNAADGRRLAVRVWSPASAPRARVVLLHGITSHGGWYDRSCAKLADAGFDVHFLDRRGSGLNLDAPGDIDNWETWLSDVTVYLNQNPQQLPNVLAGISWGGKLAAAVARRQPSLLRGLALICPGLFSPHGPGIAGKLALLAPVPARMKERRLSVPLRDPALFTDAPKWREFIATDPFALRKITWRFAREDRKLTQFARGAAPYLRMPLLVMLAGRDRIVDNRRTRSYFFRTTTAQRTLIEYPNAGHTLEFESDPSQYFADLTDWIGQTVGR